MPYMIVKRKEKFLVYKRGKDGKPVGKKLGTHPNPEKARKQIRAIQINIQEDRYKEYEMKLTKKKAHKIFHVLEHAQHDQDDHGNWAKGGGKSKSSTPKGKKKNAFAKRNVSGQLTKDTVSLLPGGRWKKTPRTAVDPPGIRVSKSFATTDEVNKAFETAISKAKSKGYKTFHQTKNNEQLKKDKDRLSIARYGGKTNRIVIWGSQTGHPVWD